MSNAHLVNTMTSNSPTNGKNSLTFESIVCSQLELKRHAASFTNRRNTMCRRLSYIPSSSPPSSTTTTTTGTAISISPLNARASTSSTLADLSIHFLKTKDSTNDRKRSRAASFNSTTGNTLRQSVAERQSVGSILYWDPSRNPSTTRHESQVSKWSIDFHKDTPHYGSLRSRLVEEYTDCESLLEFAKKTVLVLIQTKVATVFLGLLLILPITMMSIGVSHLSDCPKQTHLPIYLFVAGIVWTTKLLQNIWHKYRLQQKASNDEEPPSERNDGHAFIDGLMTSFLIIWFFLGHYWLSTLDYPLQFEQPLENPDVWCDKSVVLCTFASIFITYFILITFIIIVVCLVCCTRYTIIKRASSSQI